MCGAMAEWLRRGLQILARRFDSGSRLSLRSFYKSPIKKSQGKAKNENKMIDKVSSNNAPSKISSTRKTTAAKRRPATQNFSDHLPTIEGADANEEVEENAGISSTQIADIDGLLSLQEATYHDKNKKGHARRHGEDMLEGLRKLQLAILSGDVSNTQLEHVERLIAQTPEQSDKTLQEIIEQIALRTRIELAKRRQLQKERTYSGS